METKQTKSNQIGERLIDQYEHFQQRLREIESIDIDRLSLEGLKELCYALEIEMRELDSERASKLPGERRYRFKQHYLTIIQGYKDTVRKTDSLNELLDKLNKLKAIKDKREATFEKTNIYSETGIEKIKVE